MRAMAIDRFGGRDEITEMELDEPKLGLDSVVIRTAGAGVNPVDTKIRQGNLEGAFPHHFPLILGWDVAGTVEKVGPAVTRFAPGDSVFAYLRFPDIGRGTYAELAGAPEDYVASAPHGIELADAGGVPLVGLTAQQCVDVLMPNRGDIVLVHAASGGVGHLVVQLCALAEARVIATCSPDNHDFVSGLGAAEVIDYRDQDVPAAVRELAPDGVHAVFDPLGGEVQTEGLELLRPGGALVSIATPPDAEACDRAGVRGRYVFVRPDAAGLERLGGLIDREELRVEVADRLPLGEAANAHRRSEDGHVRGKLVLTP